MGVKSEIFKLLFFIKGKFSLTTYCSDEMSGADVELGKIFAEQLGLASFRWLRTNTWGGPIDKEKTLWTGIVGNVSG